VSAYTDLVAWVHANATDPTTTVTRVPSNVSAAKPYVGAVAVYYANADYVYLSNAGMIDLSLPEFSAPSGAGVFVVAPSAVQQSPEVNWSPSPYGTVTQTPSMLDRLENTVFTAGDQAANAVGLPSLDDFENFLKDTGKQILIGVVVTAGVAYLIRRNR
jgi:hypothetical protein